MSWYRLRPRRCWRESSNLSGLSSRCWRLHRLWRAYHANPRRVWRRTQRTFPNPSWTSSQGNADPTIPSCYRVGGILWFPCSPRIRRSVCSMLPRWLSISFRSWPPYQPHRPARWFTPHSGTIGVRECHRKWRRGTYGRIAYRPFLWSVSSDGLPWIRSEGPRPRVAQPTCSWPYQLLTSNPWSYGFLLGGSWVEGQAIYCYRGVYQLWSSGMVCLSSHCTGNWPWRSRPT